MDYHDWYEGKGHHVDDFYHYPVPHGEELEAPHGAHLITHGMVAPVPGMTALPGMM